jgi:exosortase D (VPLPA-CTERM-specific)
MKEQSEYLKRIKPAGWLKSSLYALLIVVVFQSALKHLILYDWSREDYSHCALIPFVILYLIWEKRERLITLAPEPSWLGMIPFVVGIGLFWVGELGGEFFTMYVSLLLVVVGLLWLHLGWQKIKSMGFALFIALTMFPFPNLINAKVLVKLKLISSQLGVAMLQMYGISAYREGNIIDLGFTQLQVVDACSGMRYVLPLMVLSLLLAYWFKGSLWKKAVIFFSSLPLAVLVNSLRIALTGILYSAWGLEVAEGFFHGFSGWLIFMITLPVLLLEMWVLGKIGQKAESVRGKGEIDTGTKKNQSHWIPASAGMTNTPKENTSILKSMMQPVFVVSMVVLIATYALSHGIEFREKIPINKSFREFPMAMGEWTGKHQSMDQAMIDALHFSDYIMATYQNKQLQPIDFYVAYYESQRKGEATHSPETCLPGSGWEFKQSGTTSLDLGGGKSMRVNRALMVKNDYRQLAYFWFPQRGRILTSLPQVKLYAFWDALTKQRTDGALVRVITPVGDGEKIEQAEKRLADFVRVIEPVLEEFIPK